MEKNTGWEFTCPVCGEMNIVNKEFWCTKSCSHLDISPGSTVIIEERAKIKTMTFCQGRFSVKLFDDKPNPVSVRNEQPKDQNGHPLISCKFCSDRDQCPHREYFDQLDNTEPPPQSDAQKCEHGAPLGACGRCMGTTAPKCEHGTPLGACGRCMAANAPKCKHGIAFYCSICGIVK